MTHKEHKTACPACEGHGTHAELPFADYPLCVTETRCGSCAGSGELEACRRCDGEGMLDDGAQDCPACLGFGADIRDWEPHDRDEDKIAQIAAERRRRSRQAS